MGRPRQYRGETRTELMDCKTAEYNEHNRNGFGSRRRTLGADEMRRCGARPGSAAPSRTVRKIRIGSPAFVVAVVATMALVTACEEDQAPPVEHVRAIKTFTITEVASGQTRKFAGQVHATDSSILSFQVSGNVREMRVKLGDRVKKDKVLAVLDKQPYQLDVQSANAELQKARSELAQGRQEFKRQRTLYKKGWVAKARLDRVRRSRDSARSQVEFATSKLNLAKRDLRLTALRAPYDGAISRKYVDAFVEVKTGQRVYEIEAAGALEVRFDIPETTISRVTLGMPVTVTFPTTAGSILRARITEIGSSAGRANAFPVK